MPSRNMVLCDHGICDHLRFVTQISLFNNNIISTVIQGPGEPMDWDVANFIREVYERPVEIIDKGNTVTMFIC